MEKLDLLVVIDPYPSATAAMAAMPDGRDLNANRAVYLLPAATQFETAGSVTASNRSLQWREKVIEPLFESRTDHMIMYQLAQKLGFGKELVARTSSCVKGKGGMDEPEIEDILREINQGMLDHRLHRPVARAAEGAHAQHARLRREDAARQGRQGQGDRLRPRRRLLRPAVAVLRHARDQAPGLAEPVRHVDVT